MSTQPTLPITLKEVRTIAREAYIYGYPIVDNMRIHYSYFMNRGDPEYKGPYNQIFNIPRVYTPDDQAIQTPNSDTPYSWIGLDLRTEPLVITVPPTEKERYWSLQLIDLYTPTSLILAPARRVMTAVALPLPDPTGRAKLRLALNR